MAYHYDGYLTFGTRVDESGFEKGATDLKNLASLSAKAVSVSFLGSAGNLSLFATAVNSGLEKITEKALSLENSAKKNVTTNAFEMQNAMSGLEKAVAAISEESMQRAKERAVSYKELGSLYLKNMKAGMEEEASAAITRMEWRMDANVSAFAEVNKKAAPAYRKAAKELMAVYKEAINDGANEAYKLVATRIENITEVAQKQYDAIMNERQRMENKLSDYGDLFSFDESGEVQLEKIDRQIEGLERYAQILDKLQEKGISQGLLDEVLDMSVKDGMAFGEELLSKSDSFFEEYSKTWDEKQDLVREIAAKFYEKELKALDEDFSGELEKALNDIPAICQNVGIDAMEGVVNGMESRRGEAVATARSIADAIIVELKRATETASPSKRAAREVGKPITQGVIKGMKDAYDPQELQAYTDRMMADIGQAQSKAAEGVLQKNTSNVWNSSTYNGGDFILNVEKVINDGKGSVSSLLQEAEFYRKQKVSATGGA